MYNEMQGSVLLRVIIGALSDTIPVEHRPEGKKESHEYLGELFKAEGTAHTKALSKN